jgi:hypothetical protein
MTSPSNRSKPVLIFVLGTAVIASMACSTEGRDFERAKAVNTVESYSAFLKAHPDATDRQAARDAIRALEEQQDFLQAQQANTASAYTHFLEAHPNAASASSIRKIIDQLEQEAELRDLPIAIKYFWNGDAANNKILSLNGIDFSPRDQKASSGGLMMVGASNTRISDKRTNEKTGKTIRCVYEPTSNMLIERIDTLDFDEGVHLTFAGGRTYVYKGKVWVRQ